jgi:polyketide cyclase/dehydrase/lipid transport protein
MKYLLIVMGTLFALLLLVVVIGVLLPKTHTASRSAVFKTTPEQLFALIDGPQTWRSNVKKYEPVGFPDGRRQWRETDDHGKIITYEAVERHPPTLLKTRIVTGNLPYSGTWTLNLEPGDGLTVLRITEHGDVYNPVFRFVSRFLIGHTRTIDNYIRDLEVATGQKAEMRD